MATYEELMSKAKTLAAEGRTDEAKRVASIAVKVKSTPAKAPMGQRVKEFFLGDDDPTTQNTGEKIGSLLNKAGESMTFGLVGDEASAAVAGAIPGGMDYDQRLAHERQQERLIEQANPGMSLAADIGGAMAAPIGAVGAVGKGAGMLKKASAASAATGGLSGLYGFMEGEGGASNRLDDAKGDTKVGAAIGAAIPVAGAGIQRVADAVKRNRGIAAAVRGAPSSDELAAEGRRLYQQIDDAGVQVRPESFDRARGKITDTLRGETGFDELPGPGSLTPRSARVMQIMGKASDEMAAEPTAALPFRSIDQMRRQAGSAAGNITEKADQQAGMKIIEGLDDFVNKIGPDDVVAGDVKALQTALPKARETWSRMKKSQLVDDAMSQQGNYLSGDASAIRNRFASILRSEKLSRGFDEAEKAAMRRVVSGTIPQQLLNYMGSGLGMMGQMGLGASIGGLPGAIVGTASGAGARKLANTMTERNAEIARALIASGKAAQVPMQASPEINRIAEKLLRQGTAAVPQ